MPDRDEAVVAQPSLTAFQHRGERRFVVSRRLLTERLDLSARTLVTLKLSSRVAANGSLKVLVANANGFEITGNLGGETVTRITVSRKRKIKLKAKSFRVPARAKKTVTLKLTKPLRKLLKRQQKLKLLLRAKVKDPRRTTRTVTKRVTARPKRR
jgi:hypothetical protein